MIIFEYCRKLNLAIVMTFPPFFGVVKNRPIKRNVFTSRALRQAPNSIFSFREPIWARGLLASFMCRAPPGNGYAKPFHPGAGPLPPSPPPSPAPAPALCPRSTPSENVYAKTMLIPLLLLLLFLLVILLLLLLLLLLLEMDMQKAFQPGVNRLKRILSKCTSSHCTTWATQFRIHNVLKVRRANIPLRRESFNCFRVQTQKVYSYFSPIPAVKKSCDKPT